MSSIVFAEMHTKDTQDAQANNLYLLVEKKQEENDKFLHTKRTPS